MKSYSQKGQVLLIVVLIMVISLTVGLALASRSIVNLRNTNTESDSQKAFQAAEAGIEIALQKPFNTTDQTIYSSSSTHLMNNQSKITDLTIHYLGGPDLILNDGNPITQDQGLDVWLTNYPNYSGTPWTGKLNIYWGDKAGCSDAALEVIVISGQSATDSGATINRYGVDPCGSNSVDTSKNRTGQNNFVPAQSGGSVSGTNFNFSTAMNITNGIIVRLIPLYTSTPIGITGQDATTSASLPFPVQGRMITSLGEFGSTQRQVSFFQGYPLLPSEFFYSILQQ